MWPFRSADQLTLGRLGEKIALRFLKKRGMKVLARNYRCPAGEVDLIVLDRSTRRTDGHETIVIVEVKTRRCDRYTDPQSAVDAAKRRRIRKVAEHYLTGHDAQDFNVRFDVVAVVCPPDQRPEVAHIPDAF